MDLTAMFSMTYGLYVVSAEADGVRSACLVNTATQVTAEPPRLIVSVHKDNFTANVIARAGAFTVTAVDMTADMKYIGNFGFRTSADYDKFANFNVATSAVGSPYVTDHACAMMACHLLETLDAGTHRIFMGEIVECARLSDAPPLTYAYYHGTLKGKTPPKAASYKA
ncbi:flavin reductase domain protein FMN-binding protein [Coriobacterium glomerans PW2]|uniref:Flavin reductase domain protein FMN-binding protein n=1 Tax=Coriobacterium glomerans (strain ATCC 49209 / DSM 20642 / JCM 10262 / PW2) TaxID=700015 RepID=F2N7E6_CORGP|nr:flavin reductase family protein [Coriobacterium glomerans]AEB06762.1 flavin reductase domain protein FMN-binding protein [Coriobacterium glomerans PW2]